MLMEENDQGEIRESTEGWMRRELFMMNCDIRLTLLLLLLV